MASPPPSYTPVASVSRSKTSPDQIRSMANEMLHASISRSSTSGVSASASASVSRSKTSPDEIRSLADEMLRASLSRSSSSQTLPASSSSTAPPPYSRKISPTLSPSTPPWRLPGDRADTIKSGHECQSESVPVVTNTSFPHKTGSASAGVGGNSSCTSRVSAAEAKRRVRELQREVDYANAKSPQRATAGLFKEACATDLLFLIDTTGSMGPYIDAAKEQVKSIVDDIKRAFLNESQVRVAVVGYKDHTDTPSIQFLDFTPSADEVRQFLSKLTAIGGYDAPEDVLGGIRQALYASWKQQTRCIIHITDAPPHGRILHDLHETEDSYIRPGSEPHGLTHEPLLKQLIQLNINYALLRINSLTDRMALVFSQLYAAAGADVKLLQSNVYHGEAGTRRSASASARASAGPQFEELQLGTTYSVLRHLVVRSVTSSVTRTAGHMTQVLSSGSKASSTAGNFKKLTTNITAIKEEGGSRDAGDVSLETLPPQWDAPGWLDKTLVVEGFCPNVVVHSASTLNEMMENDENIKLSVTQLTVYTRAKPFAQGALRVAAYARTAASTDRFVIKSFKKDGKELVHLAEDMRIQALCKAFALQFNGLLKLEDPIDFIVTTCLQSKLENTSRNECLSLEPFLEGEYVKYNNNNGWIKEDSPDDSFNQTAQAFSHFTFERSWGHFLVADLQGVGHLLTDPSIQTLDKERFKLNDTNLNVEGFKFFFATHECNPVCRKLKLESNREMFIGGNYRFREHWPTMEATVCCSNKLCRRIIRLASANESDKFPGYHWCNKCWPQLQSSMIRWYCVAPGPDHEFDVSKFFYESQGQATPRKCPEHLEKDTTVSSAAVVGGGLWRRMKSINQKGSISGRSW